VHRVARVLANAARHDATGVRRGLRALLGAMRRWSHRRAARRASRCRPPPWGWGFLRHAVAHFLAVTRSYWPGLFHCFDRPALPRTNNALEQYFATARYRERRATGRRGASPALVVRGSARVVACVATPPGGFRSEDLAPADLTAWRTLRASLEARQESRRAQLRFRRDPAGYLATLEQQLLQPALPP